MDQGGSFGGFKID
jgi:hypothetical protein